MCIEYIVQGQSLTLLFPYICTVWNQSPADQQFESGTHSLLYYCIDFYSRKELILLYTKLILFYIMCNYIQYVLILLYTKLILFYIIMCNYIQYVLILLCTKELILLYY